MISSSWQLWAKAVTIKPLLSAQGVRSRLKSPGSRFVPVRMQIKVTLSEVGFPVGSESEESACRAGHPGSIPGSGRFPGEGKANPLQYSCLENSVDSGGWWATVHGVAGSDMTKQLTDFRFNMFSWNKPPSLLSLEYTATGKMMLFFLHRMSPRILCLSWNKSKALLSKHTWQKLERPFPCRAHGLIDPVSGPDSCSFTHPHGAGVATCRGGSHSQVGQARLAHGWGNGFDGRQHGVEQLRELPGAFGLTPLFHNVAGQGKHIRFEGASVPHGGG